MKRVRSLVVAAILIAIWTANQGVAVAATGYGSGSLGSTGVGAVGSTPGGTGVPAGVDMDVTGLSFGANLYWRESAICRSNDRTASGSGTVRSVSSASGLMPEWLIATVSFGRPLRPAQAFTS